jgi:hypothetical protein
LETFVLALLRTNHIPLSGHLPYGPFSAGAIREPWAWEYLKQYKFIWEEHVTTTYDLKWDGIEFLYEFCEALIVICSISMDEDLDVTTVDLLSRGPQEIYGVIARMYDLIRQNPLETRDLLIRNPRFTRAIYQAQLQLGVACLDLTTDDPSSAASSPIAAPPPPLIGIPASSPHGAIPSGPLPMPAQPILFAPMGIQGAPMMAPQMGGLWSEQTQSAAAQIGIDPQFLAMVTEMTLAQFSQLDASAQSAVTSVRTMMGLSPTPTA